MTDAQTIANEQSKPGVFNLVERLQNRGMPTEDVDVYLDERLGWDLLRLEEKHNNTKNVAEAKIIEGKIKRVKEQLAESRYVFTLQGVTNEGYQAVIDRAAESFPYEYEERVNPLTAEKTKVLIENDERDTLFNTLFLAEVITKVSDPDGDEDADITPEKVTFIKNLAPLDAIRRITELAFKMRMATEWMDVIQDEDFSPRP